MHSQKTGFSGLLVGSNKNPKASRQCEKQVAWLPFTIQQFTRPFSAYERDCRSSGWKGNQWRASSKRSVQISHFQGQPFCYSCVEACVYACMLRCGRVGTASIGTTIGDSVKVKWGPSKNGDSRSPFCRYPGSPFYQKFGDPRCLDNRAPLVKIWLLKEPQRAA